MPDTKTNVNVGAQTAGLFTNSAVSDAGLTLYDTMLGYGTYLIDNQGWVVNSCFWART